MADAENRCSEGAQNAFRMERVDSSDCRCGICCENGTYRWVIPIMPTNFYKLQISKMTNLCVSLGCCCLECLSVSLVDMGGLDDAWGEAQSDRSSEFIINGRPRNRTQSS